MRSLQRTVANRCHVRHRKWGKLFGDRYKVVIVQEGDRP